MSTAYDAGSIAGLIQSYIWEKASQNEDKADLTYFVSSCNNDIQAAIMSCARILEEIDFSQEVDDMENLKFDGDFMGSDMVICGWEIEEIFWEVASTLKSYNGDFVASRSFDYCSLDSAISFYRDNAQECDEAYSNLQGCLGDSLSDCICTVANEVLTDQARAEGRYFIECVDDDYATEFIADYDLDDSLD